MFHCCWGNSVSVGSSSRNRLKVRSYVEEDKSRSIYFHKGVWRGVLKKETLREASKKKFTK